jgi:enamine deaminase RidA (YjgF/YER057c/UK114 family)
MIKEYITYLPASPGSTEEEWEQCLEQIKISMKAGMRPVKLNVFTDSPDYPSFIKIKESISKSLINSFGSSCPAIGITIHPPEKPGKICVEGLLVRSDTPGISTKFWQSIPYVVIESKSSVEIWGAGMGNDMYWKDTRKAACIAFDSILDILEHEGLSLNNLVRQWNYIGNILEVKNGFQNYQVFNEVRSEYFAKYRTVSGYPAATGIGMKFGGVFLDFCALKVDNAVKIKPVDNPNQINAYEYSQNVLKGISGKGKPIKHPPQFERALLVANGLNKNLFISGTASIIGQETIGRGDVREQTIVTIENIRKLTDLERINQIAGDSGSITGRYSLLRVYVKNQEDFEVVRSVCDEHFPKIPACFIESDICREDLLTEIECEFIIF